MNFDWKEIFLGDLDWDFSTEILIRTVIMFLMILLILRLSGKKGVRQLSLFEVAIIIAMGSAAGDPMFDKEIAIIPSFIVFAAIISVYRMITYFASKSEKFEDLVEGEPLYVIEEGQFVLGIKKKHTFAKDEFFAEMRQQSVEHLGQIKTAILETTGNISFYYYADEDVKHGLPVLPKQYQQKSFTIADSGIYSCTYCGFTEFKDVSEASCKRCDQKEWVRSINTLRLT